MTRYDPNFATSYGRNYEPVHGYSTSARPKARGRGRPAWMRFLTGPMGATLLAALCIATIWPVVGKIGVGLGLAFMFARFLWIVRARARKSTKFMYAPAQAGMVRMRATPLRP